MASPFPCCHVIHECSVQENVHTKKERKTRRSYDILNIIWDKVFKSGPSKICGTQALNNLKGYGLCKADHTPSNFFKVVFHKFYLVHFRILCLM